MPLLSKTKPMAGFEPTTSRLLSGCSTAKLHWHVTPPYPILLSFFKPSTAVNFRRKITQTVRKMLPGVCTWRSLFVHPFLFLPLITTSHPRHRAPVKAWRCTYRIAGVVGLVVRISAFQADGPGSIPGRRILCGPLCRNGSDTEEHFNERPVSRLLHWSDVV